MDPVTETPTEPVDYAAINAVWAGLLGGTLALTRGTAPESKELPVYALAAFAMTKAISREKVGTWARAPVVDEREGRPKGSRLRYAAGELLTCTRCLGTWSSLGLVGLHAARPREARIVATVLATAGLNDWLQSGFSWVCSKANAEKAQAELKEQDRDARFSALP